MASVFLSYDHQDSARAQQIAHALEEAGHQVWWDRHIHGGAQYAREIEQAIDRADAVVVLWSRHSIDSEWVRDEATAGKTRGRLVPATIDGAEAPMGFRQLQLIDLSARRGRKSAAGLGELQRAIAALAGGAAVPPTVTSSRLVPSGHPFAIGSFVLLALAALALFLWKPWRGGLRAPTVTVEAGDGSAASTTLANSLFVQLGSLQASRGDLLQLAEPQSGIDPDLSVKVSAQPAERGAGAASVALIDARKSTLVWSKEFVPQAANAADQRQQVAYATAKVLECAAKAAQDGKKLDSSTYKLFLNGCVDLSTATSNEIPELVESFRKITKEAPRFAGGWSGLLVAEIDAHLFAGLNDPQLRRNLQVDVAKAREFHPELVEAYMAESWLQPPRPIIGWMRFAEKAVEVDPNHPAALIQRAMGYMHVGRVQEAVADSRKAAQFDPLSPGTRTSLIYTLLEAGEADAARKELAQMERLWPGSSLLNEIRFQVEYRIGDPRKALAMARSGELPVPVSKIRVASLEAKTTGSTEAVERATRYARQQFAISAEALGAYVQSLAEFGKKEEAFELLLSVDPAKSPGVILYLFRPAFSELQRDPRFITVASRFGLLDYWRETAKWADFCARPDLPYDCQAEARRIEGASRAAASVRLAAR